MVKTAKEHTAEAAQPTPKLMVEEWFQTWFELYSKPNLRETTQGQYTNFIEKHLVPELTTLSPLRVNGSPLISVHKTPTNRREFTS